MQPRPAAPAIPRAIDEEDAWQWEEPRPRVTFSGTEILHLVLSVAVLSAAFSFALAGKGVLAGAGWDDIVVILPFAAAIVVTSFVLHELAHKVVAQRRALWAEYRSSWIGLGIGLVLSALTGFVLAAPGAVHIYGRASERDSGVISLVGPLVNLGLGFAAYPLMFVEDGLRVGSFSFWEIVVFINAGLALFNMLPIHPLDGSKIWRWSKTAYLVVLGICAALLFLYFNGVVASGRLSI